MANNKKLLYFYEGFVNKGTEGCRWFYAVPRDNGVQYDVYELNFKEKSYDLVRAEDVTFNYNAKKFSIKTDAKALKRKFNSFTIRNIVSGDVEKRMFFFENTLGMEVFLSEISSRDERPQRIEFQHRVKDIAFNDCNYMIERNYREVMERKTKENN